MRWSVIGGQKTLAGSLVFTTVAVAIGLVIGAGAGEVRFLAVVGAALVLALVEGSLGYGLDNIPVPAVASLLGISALGL
jgi:dolichol kinase